MDYSKWVGIDLGVRVLAITSDGEEFQTPRDHTSDKFRKRVDDICTDLWSRYDYICLETLNLPDLKDWAPAGGKIRDIYYRHRWRVFDDALNATIRPGKRLVYIDQFFASSKTCHVCGVKFVGKMGLGVRKWTCSNGHKLDRDQNAAANIKAKGISEFIGFPIPYRRSTAFYRPKWDKAKSTATPANDYPRRKRKKPKMSQTSVKTISERQLDQNNWGEDSEEFVKVDLSPEGIRQRIIDSILG